MTLQNGDETTLGSVAIRPLPSLAMLNHCAVCDGPAEFGIYRTVEGVEVLTAVVCGEHTVRPKESTA
jgi:hypothetical protein